jgi:transcriptional regulator GlxA family with amidase domain
VSAELAILVFEDAEELDVVGPYETLALWATGGGPARIRLVAERPGSIHLAHGMRIEVTEPAAESSPEVLIVPGGSGARAAARGEHQARIELVRRLAARASLVAGVCTGALVLARAGLLSARRATTHWSALRLLAELDPSIAVEAEARVVRDGPVATSAGITAGIDLALALIEWLDTQSTSDAVRRRLAWELQPRVVLAGSDPSTSSGSVQR